MKKIGEGYYYKVYDLGNGKVLKKLKNKFQIFLYILFRNLLPVRTLSEYRKTINNIPKLKIIYARISKSLPNLEILGNPIFLEGIDYEQDKVIPLKEILQNKSESECKLVIEDFIALIKKFWEFGFHEVVFNFTINNGLNENNKVILIDFNEITFEKSVVKNDIDRKIWLKKWSYWSLPSNIKQYYKKRMLAEITCKNLNSLWNQNKLN